MKKVIECKKEDTPKESIEQKNIFVKIGNYTLNHFFITFIALYATGIILLFLGQKLASIISGIILLIYVIVFSTYRIKVNIQKFLHHELGLKEILSAYVTSALFIILLFSILFWLMTAIGAGYLKYGVCEDNIEITRELIASDPKVVTDIMHYPYFSATTFFSVGYGDICPMGINKLVAILNAVVGNIFTVLILAIAITNYSANKTERDNKKKTKE